MNIDPKTYFRTLYDALGTVSLESLEQATRILSRVYDEDRTIYVVGNGQSATTASAFALDLAKQSASPHRRRFRTVALTDNMAAITAWANDKDYESVFVEQLESLFRPRDVLVAISASGNSPNVVRAGEWVREHAGDVVGLTGFGGGRLCELADACIVVGIADYGHIETAHLAILHYWVDFFRERLSR